MGEECLALLYSVFYMFRNCCSEHVGEEVERDRIKSREEGTLMKKEIAEWMRKKRGREGTREEINNSGNDYKGKKKRGTEKREMKVECRRKKGKRNIWNKKREMDKKERGRGTERTRKGRNKNRMDKKGWEEEERQQRKVEMKAE